MSPLLDKFCTPSTCAIDLPSSTLTASEWCRSNTPCNIVLDDTGRFCFTAFKNATEWKTKVVEKFAALANCSVPVDILLPSSAL